MDEYWIVMSSLPLRQLQSSALLWSQTPQHCNVCERERERHSAQVHADCGPRPTLRNQEHQGPRKAVSIRESESEHRGREGERETSGCH
jgi:hypothetical protein